MLGVVPVMTRRGRELPLNSQLGMARAIVVCLFDAIRQTSTLQIRLVAKWNASVK